MNYESGEDLGSGDVLGTTIGAGIYVIVGGIAVLTVPLDALGSAEAPLALVLERSAGITGTAISAIAVAAVLNGVLIQMVMASRVLYGLARMGNLPAVLATVNATTHTPVRASLLVVAIVLCLAMAFSLDALAQTTSILILSVFSLVNLALWRIKRREAAPPGVFTVPGWLPITGFFVSVAFLFADLVRRLVF